MAPVDDAPLEHITQAEIDGRNANVAKRLAKTLQVWMVKACHLKEPQDNPEAIIDHGWEQIWDFCDASGKGVLFLEDFINMVQRVLHVRGIHVQDLESLWIDVVQMRNAQNTMSKSEANSLSGVEFAMIIYKMYIQIWPDYNELQLSRCVHVLNEKADKVHKCAGNWYKVFNKFRLSTPGWIDFNDFLNVIRRSNPGLSLSTKELHDMDIRGMWRVADAGCAGRLTVRDFIRFTRYYAQIKRKNQSLDQDGDVEYDKHKLRSIAVRLSRAMEAWHSSRGVSLKLGENALSDPNCRWCMVFTFTDDDGNCKIDIDEFVRTVRCILKAKDITDAELRAWFRSLHLTDSEQVRPEEFALAVYRLEVDWWPVLPEVQVNNCVRVLNNAARHWHYRETQRSYHVTYGSWFKILNAQGADGHVNQTFAEKTDCVRAARSVDYNEFVGVVRGKWPGLHIHPRDLSDDELRGVWKCIDVDRLGKVKFCEFMQFMRSHTHDEDQGICGGRLLNKSINHDFKKLQEKQMAATLPESASKMYAHGYPVTPRTAAEYQRAKAEAEKINADRRLKWVKHTTGSSSGIMRQEDALRNVFLTEDGRSRVNREMTAPLSAVYERITA